MKLKMNLFASIGLLTLSYGSLAQAQTYTISTATGPFAPSFRDGTNTDANNTTYFGWTAGSFDGTPDNNILDNPTPTLGTGGLTGSLNQVGATTIISGSNNIFLNSAGMSETVTLNIPTSGIVGSGGFTTLIIQGMTAIAGSPSGLIASPPVFGSIGGVNPTFVIGGNSLGAGQWWAKYELTGNQASYAVSITLANTGGPTQPVSIARLEVDSQYSSTGFAPDQAQAVPEPSTYVFLALGGLVVAWQLGRGRRLTA
jgi:hypothetical protein